MGERSPDGTNGDAAHPEAPGLAAGDDAGARVEGALAARRLAEARAAESERRVQELSDALAAARAAASTGSLVLAKLSHELRTPLNGIIGLAEILRHKAAAGAMGPAEAHRLAGDIHESGIHLLNLVEALLDLSRLDVAEHLALQASPRAVPRMAIRTEIDVALTALGPIADRKGIVVDNRCDPAIAWTVERRVFRQVAINLASNAIKFSPRGSTVRIAATCNHESLALHVGDEGPGVAEGDRERILMPFDRGRDADTDGIDGVGLGLTIVAELLKRQGGRLVIESASGGGSVFTAVFPAPESSAAGGRGRGPQDAGSRGTSRAEAIRS